MFFSWCFLLLVASTGLSGTHSLQAGYEYGNYGSRSADSGFRAELFLKEKANLSGPKLVEESVDSANSMMESLLKAVAAEKRSGGLRADIAIAEVEEKIKIAEGFAKLLQERSKLNSRFQEAD